MTRTTNQAQEYRIPITDAAIPDFLRSNELYAWADANKVEILPDHQNRLSISVADAYRVRAEADAAAQAHLEAEAARRARNAAEVRDAQGKRQRVFSEAYAKAARKADTPWGGQGDDPDAVGWEAVREAEKKLDPAIRDQLSAPTRQWAPLSTVPM